MAKINLVMDTTSMDTFQSCPEKFYLRHVRNRVPELKAKPLDRGSLIHIGFEAYFKSLQTDAGKWDLAMQRCLVKTRFAISNESELPTDESNRVLEVLEESCNVWKYKDLSYEILAIEQPFSYVVYEDEQFRFVLIGKIDLLVNDAPNYFKLPIDHKSYERNFPPRRSTNQFMNYSFAVQSNYLLVNRVGMSESISLGKGKSSKKPEDRHKRVPLSYDPLIWESWKKDIIKWFFLYYDCLQENYWHKNFTSCDKFNRLCEYYEGFCDVSGEENREYKLMTFYKETEPWDVSKALKSGDSDKG